MAESRKNIITHGLSGRVGDIIVFSQRNGKTIVSRAPGERTKPGTAAQQAVKVRFQKAVIYGKAAIVDPAVKAGYDAVAEPGQSAYNVAVADFFNAPEIEEVDFTHYTGQVGDSIRIRATDDFKVVTVHVKIENPDNSLVEEGYATQNSDGLDWTYIATQLNASLTGDKITITATDTPVNLTVKQEIL